MAFLAFHTADPLPPGFDAGTIPKMAPLGAAVKPLRLDRRAWSAEAQEDFTARWAYSQVIGLRETAMTVHW